MTHNAVAKPRKSTFIVQNIGRFALTAVCVGLIPAFLIWRGYPALFSVSIFPAIMWTLIVTLSATLICSWARYTQTLPTFLLKTTYQYFLTFIFLFFWILNSLGLALLLPPEIPHYVRLALSLAVLLVTTICLIANAWVRNPEKWSEKKSQIGKISAGPS